MNELRIENLSYTYRNGTRALRGVDLTIGNGMFGLLGPNGAGKSTLMRIISTLQDPDQGSVAFNDLNVTEDKTEVRKLLGFLPQEFDFYPKITAWDMLDHFAVLKGITNYTERKKTVEFFLDKTNLYEARNKKLGGFSGGMKQRFGIAQALLGDPKLVIVDEPTAGLDPEERYRFHNLLSEIGENIIIILSTHIVDDIRELCSNMAIIDNGEVLLIDNPQTTIDNYIGKIKKRVIEKNELIDYQDNYNVVSSRLYLGKMLIHVFSEEEITDFEPISPDLEDVYFLTINESRKRNKGN
jgi:ABC-2 type transport system ATP-binding protein